MKSFCSLNFSAVICFISFLLLILSLTGNFWYEVKESIKKEEASEHVANKFRSSFNIGLWTTCFSNKLPDTGLFIKTFLFNIEC